MLSDFKKFVLRGNVVDLAVGVVMGVAFGAVITAIVSGLLKAPDIFKYAHACKNLLEPET